MSQQGPLSTLEKVFKSLKTEESLSDNEGAFGFDLEKQVRVTKTLMKLRNQEYVFANDSNIVLSNKSNTCKK